MAIVTNPSRRRILDATRHRAPSPAPSRTSFEAGRTVKVRVTFTDDGGTEETLVSAATAPVTVVLPSVSIAAVSSPVSEGTAASFRLSRTGDTARALTLSAPFGAAIAEGTATGTIGMHPVSTAFANRRD